MKAVVFNPEKVAPTMTEWADPTAGSKEVVILVHAAALNHRDLNITRPSVEQSILYGSDGSGVIDSVGGDVTDLHIGDEVIIDTYITCGHCHQCLSGNGSLCEEGRVLGGLRWPGTFAEYVRVPARNVVKKPAHLDFVQAAALPMAFGTAWRALITNARLQPGETVLIQGIGGGVALAALQIAVNVGARVIVTSGSDEKVKNAIELGASAGINYKTEDVVARVKEFTNGEGVHVSLSSGGMDSIATAVATAVMGGRIVQYAYLGRKLPAFDIDVVMGKQLKLIGSADSGNEEFRDAIDFVESHKITPVVSDVLPFENAIEAFQQMRDGVQFGKIVIRM